MPKKVSKQRRLTHPSSLVIRDHKALVVRVFQSVSKKMKAQKFIIPLMSRLCGSWRSWRNAGSRFNASRFAEQRKPQHEVISKLDERQNRKAHEKSKQAAAARQKVHRIEHRVAFSCLKVRVLDVD